MGYFGNGTAGEQYVAQWCSKCIHQRDDDICAVWLLHLNHNYDDDYNDILNFS